MEFSKRLAIFVSVVFAFVVVLSAITYLVLDRIPSELLTIVSTPFMVVITGYFAKAGVENYTKIKGTDSPE